MTSVIIYGEITSTAIHIKVVVIHFNRCIICIRSIQDSSRGRSFAFALPDWFHGCVPRQRLRNGRQHNRVLQAISISTRPKWWWYDVTHKIIGTNWYEVLHIYEVILQQDKQYCCVGLCDIILQSKPRPPNLQLQFAAAVHQTQKSCGRGATYHTFKGRTETDTAAHNNMIRSNIYFVDSTAGRRRRRRGKPKVVSYTHVIVVRSTGACYTRGTSCITAVSYRIYRSYYIIILRNTSYCCTL